MTLVFHNYKNSPATFAPPIALGLLLYFNVVLWNSPKLPRHPRCDSLMDVLYDRLGCAFLCGVTACPTRGEVVDQVQNYLDLNYLDPLRPVVDLDIQGKEIL